MNAAHSKHQGRLGVSSPGLSTEIPETAGAITRGIPETGRTEGLVPTIRNVPKPRRSSKTVSPGQDGTGKDRNEGGRVAKPASIRRSSRLRSAPTEGPTEHEWALGVGLGSSGRRGLGLFIYIRRRFGTIVPDSVG